MGVLRVYRTRSMLDRYTLISADNADAFARPDAWLNTQPTARSVAFPASHWMPASQPLDAGQVLLIVAAQVVDQGPQREAVVLGEVAGS